MNVSGNKLRPMRESDLELVRAWRNAPDTQQFMFTRHTIGADEHRRWFESASQSEGRHLLIFERDGVASGFVQFSSADGLLADWGFFKAPEAPRGSGIQLGRAGLDFAFLKRRFAKVRGEAVVTNEPSIRFHERLGFIREGERCDLRTEGLGVVVIFGLHARDWAR